MTSLHEVGETQLVFLKRYKQINIAAFMLLASGIGPEQADQVDTHGLELGSLIPDPRFDDLLVEHFDMVYLRNDNVKSYSGILLPDEPPASLFGTAGQGATVVLDAMIIRQK